VDDPFLVRRLERFRYRMKERPRFLPGKRPARDALGESFPFDELHDEKEVLVRFLDSVERRNPRMVQRSEKL
jgi:hypothetical protein